MEIVSQYGTIACESYENAMKTVGRFHRTDRNEAPARGSRGLLRSGMGRSRLVAAVDQAPAGTPRGRNQLPHIAAAVTIGRATDEDARTAPAPAAAVPSTVPAVAAPGGGGGRRQRGHTERSRGDRYKR